MKISRIQISNYRSIKSLDLAVDSFSSLLGANGSGKSSVLYALNWFFEGGPLESSDVHGHSVGSAPAGSSAPDVEVTVTFSDLTEPDRERLEQYGRGESATFKRTWSVGQAKDKVVGNALQGPGFSAVRAMAKVGEFRPAYASLLSTISGLPDLGKSPSKEEVTSAFVAWEDDPANKDTLESIDAADANHMFGIGGTSVIKQCIRMVLIPAATDISGEVGGVKKGTALNELIGTFMANASLAAKEAWIQKHQVAIDELTESMLASVKASTGLQTDRINSRLASLIPNAQVEFTAGVPEWVPSPTATVQTDVSLDGVVNDVSRQGHGIQRAVMIAMFQALVPDEALAATDVQPIEGETESEAQERLAAILRELPNLLVCIEEPEIYQHPVRARAFARVLAQLASQPNAQVIIATHSPYFARPEHFAQIRRFSLVAGETAVRSTTVDKVAARSSTKAPQVVKIVEKRLPTTFSEGFFADAVVLVEGDTDKVVIDTIAERQGRALDLIGVSVLEMSGKGGLAIPKAILEELNIPAYIVADADALGATRRYPSELVKQARAHASHKADTEKLLTQLHPSTTALEGTLPFLFGDPTVVCAHYTLWEDDIEHELSKWPSFIATLEANGYALREKNVLAYRAAIMDADMQDMPSCLNKIVTSIADFRRLALSPGPTQPW